MAVKILLVEDHSIFRESLHSMLDSVEGLTVVAESGSGKHCVDVAIREKPDVAIMDISLPDCSGIEATRAIRQAVPSCRVIILSMHDQRQFVITALKAGATGYLLKDCNSQDLVNCIRTVAAGGTCLSPKVCHLLVEDSGSQQQEPMSSLTSREVQVLKLIAEGRNTKEIAYDLHISIKTVETHRIHIMRKLNVSSVADVTKYAIREGIAAI